ncbi:MAG: hypothetical protein LIO69_00405 [Oscillospiraceae bacterium]|nr:hypothetical protein [Oscillospiraceae bacterium]
MSREDDVIEIDLYRIMMACLKKWWAFLIVMVAFGVCGYVGTKLLVAPTYESTVKLYVNNQDLSVGNVSISTSDLNASAQLVDVYEVILNTKDTLDIVIDAAGLDYDYTQVLSMIETAAVNDTQIFQVTVTSTSPQEAQLIAATIGDVLPGVIEGIVENADARIVEHAIVPTRRSAPNYTQNAAVCALIGFVIVALIIVVQVVTNISINNEDDLLDVIRDIPVLTHVPNFDGGSKKVSRYSKNYYYQGSEKGGAD